MVTLSYNARPYVCTFERKRCLPALSVLGTQITVAMPHL